MKSAWLLACVCSLVLCSAAASQTPSQAPITLASILGQPAVGGSCPTPQNGALFAAKHPRLGLAKADCSASCGSDPAVSCSGSTCSAADRACNGERGHVTCDGNTYWCPTVCCTGNCCTCDQTGDCFACCRCDGGGIGYCFAFCGY